jgi:predicted O-methyltransferase YrrM
MTNDEIPSQLAAIRAEQGNLRNVDPPEGEYFYELVKRSNARLVVEIGTSNGYSGSWFAMGLRETGGTLITVENDPGRHALAKANFETLGLAERVDSRLGDAIGEVQHLADDSVDIAFIDAEKKDYLRYFEALLPKVRKSGRILAHNVASHAADLAEFLDRIQSDPAVTTEILTIGPKGLSSSVKQ